MYPSIAPYEHGMLEVGDGNLVYWETSGNPDGKPALTLHGGPGSGSSSRWRSFFDPAAYRIVQFDQRNCGRSTPSAADPATDLAANTTHHLVADVERLRERLGIERWLLFGASWGSTLALAYAHAHPEHVSGAVLFGVTTGRRSEMDWTFRGGVAREFFPAQWERLRGAFPEARQGDADVVRAYYELLHNDDTRERAAYEWCLFESASTGWPPTPELDSVFEDPEYRMTFARLVTHYVVHDLWLEDGALLHGGAPFDAAPLVLVNGRFDFQAPLGNAWAAHRAWPSSELVVVDDAGHGFTQEVGRALVRATDILALRS